MCHSLLGKGWIEHFSATSSITEENPTKKPKFQGNEKHNNADTNYGNLSDSEKDFNQKDPPDLPATKNPNEEYLNTEKEDDDEGTVPTMKDFYDPKSKTYTVQKGDTLWSVSRYFGVTVAELKYWNHLASDSILAGSLLKVSGPPIIENFP